MFPKTNLIRFQTTTVRLASNGFYGISLLGPIGKEANFVENPERGGLTTYWLL
jgi:hypothetical protein